VNTLVAWIGKADLAASQNLSESEGPIAGLFSSLAQDRQQFGRAWLLGAGDEPGPLKRYVAWLSGKFPEIDVGLHITPIKSDEVTNYGRLLDAAVAALDELLTKDPDAELAYHLSPGTPAMTVISVLLSQTRFPGRTYQSYYDAQDRRQIGEEVAITPLWLTVLPNVLAAEARGAQLPAQAELITRDPTFQRVIGIVEVTATRSTAPLLIYGESGTGKEGLALFAHQVSEASGAFVPVNCGAVPADLLESTFFGHKKGAFSGAVADQIGAFERAHRGTLFLDEISELRPEHQVKLLRALQPAGGMFDVMAVGAQRTKRVDFRLISASNRDLKDLVWRGQFRQDLYWRLSTVEVRIPPLRERPCDVIAYVEDGTDRLLSQVFPKRIGYLKRRLTPEAINYLAHECDWPGNYRSLQRVLVRLHLRMTEETVNRAEIADLAKDLVRPASVFDAAFESAPLDQYECIIRATQAGFLRRAWRQSGHNKEGAARLLGLSSGTVFRENAERLGVALTPQGGDAKQ